MRAKDFAKALKDLDDCIKMCTNTDSYKQKVEFGFKMANRRLK